jgi:uncharacterized protein
MLRGALVLATLAAAATVPPAPTRWVTDDAGFLSASTRGALDAKLESYERATGHQVVVWIGTTLGDAALDDWAVRTFAAWKVGRQGLDDGIAMFILADDRAIDIEVGYGLEDRVTDVAASRIIREVMTPRLRAGDRDDAVTAGVDALLAAVEGRAWIDPGIGRGSSERYGPSTFDFALGVLIALGFLILAVTNPRLAMLLMWSTLGGGNRGGGWGGGGGGFGGGGGRSGGGGARGHW